MSAPAHVVHASHSNFYSGGIVGSLFQYGDGSSGILPYPYLPDLRQPPGLTKAAWHTSPLSIPPSCGQPSPPIVIPRKSPPTRPTITLSQPNRFRPENPFDDGHAPAVPTVQNDQVASHQRPRVVSQSCPIKIPRPSHLEALMRQRTAQRLAQDREARYKAVAGILLNRVYAVGKPMRRPPNQVPRTYKRSRLSTMITVNDL